MPEARKLKEHSFDEPEDTRVEVRKVVNTPAGKVVEKSYADLKVFDSFVPYSPNEKLPKAEIQQNTRGIWVCRKPGEPRYFFRGNDLMKVWLEIGKRMTIAMTFKDGNQTHQRIKKYLRERGIRGE